jgi:hypothetical protein
VRVYLDQNAWIGLLRARKGHRSGERHRDALLVVEAAIAQDRLSLPLSSVHYIETARRFPHAKRAQLASLMAALSRYHTIAPFPTLARCELRGAIARQFGSRVVPAAPTPFGLGADHAFSTNLIEQFLSRLGAAAPLAKDALEWVALAGNPEQDGSDHPVFAVHAAMQKEADRLEALRDLRRPDGWTRGEKSERVWAAQAYAESLEELNDAFAEADVPAGRLMALGADGMTRFLEAVPTLHTRYELGRLKEQATSQAWSANDLRDLQALSSAIVYADVVVTEKSWTALAQRSGLDERFGTTIVKDLNDLVSILVLAPAVKSA